MNQTWSLDSEEGAQQIYSACNQIEQKWARFINEICDRDQKEKDRRQEALALLHKQTCIEEVQAWLALAKLAIGKRIETDTKIQMAYSIMKKRCQELEDSVALNCKKKLEAMRELATKETHAAIHRIKEFRLALDRVSQFTPFSCIHFADTDLQRSISNELVNTSQSSLIDAHHRSVSVMKAFSENVSAAIKTGQHAEEEDFHSVRCNFEDSKRSQDVVQMQYDSLITKHSKTSAKISEFTNTEHAIKATSDERFGAMIKQIDGKIQFKARQQRRERQAEQKWDDILLAVSGSSSIVLKDIKTWVTRMNRISRTFGMNDNGVTIS
eukprot:jgi/Picsp_1/425/NSC_00423-R1_---NA---